MKKLLPLAALSALFAISLVTACPDSADDEGEAEGEPTKEETIAAFTGYFDRCLGDTFASEFDRRSEPTFNALLEDDFDAYFEELVTAQFNGPEIAFNASTARECIDLLETISCEAVAGGDAPDACLTVFVGTVALGDSCATSSGCVEGASCFGLTDECGVCTATVELGGDCSAADCGDNLVCEDDVCVAEVNEPSVPTEEGDPCTVEEDNCDEGFACVDDACTAIQVVQPGAACNSDELYCVDQATKNVCVAADGGADRVCTARAQLGEACTQLAFCDSTVAICVEGVCVDEGDEGDACEGALDCKAGLTCFFDGVCGALIDSGVGENEAPICEG